MEVPEFTKRSQSHSLAIYDCKLDCSSSRVFAADRTIFSEFHRRKTIAIASLFRSKQKIANILPSLGTPSRGENSLAIVPIAMEIAIKISRPSLCPPWAQDGTIS